MNKYPFQKISTAAALAAGVLSAPCATADFEMSVKIPGITEYKVKQEVDVLSWSWALSQSSAKLKDKSLLSACPKDLTFAKYVGPTTPDFIVASALGTPLDSAQLAVREFDGQALLIRELTFDMRNVVISSYKTGDSGDEDFPTENITTTFTEYKVDYTSQDTDGNTISTGWQAKDKGDCN